MTRLISEVPSQVYRQAADEYESQTAALRQTRQEMQKFLDEVKAQEEYDQWQRSLRRGPFAQPLSSKRKTR